MSADSKEMSGTTGHEDNDLDELLESALDDFKKVDISRACTKAEAESREPITGQNAAEAWTEPERPALAQAGDGPGPGSGPLPGLGLGLGMPALPAGRKGKPKAKSPSTNQTATAGASSSSSSFSFAPRPGGGGAQPERAQGQVSSSEERLTATLEKLAQQTRETVDSMEAREGGGEGGEADMAERLVKELEAMGASEDMQSLMDNMMRQLLSRDVLQEPMREIGERYPSWLEEHKGRLSREDLERYSSQYGYIQELGRVYESDPDNFERIVELMQKMQECGQPPPEIVKELAPGVELGEDGLPVLPELGPGGEGLPPNCSVM